MTGVMAGVRYREEILNVYARSYAGAIGAYFLLMNDNARPHRVNYPDVIKCVP